MQIVAWLAAGLVFASFFMRAMVPLRTTAIASNVMFIVYALLGLYDGIFDKVFPIFILHVALLPLNIIRLRGMASESSRSRAELNSEAAYPHFLARQRSQVAREITTDSQTHGGGFPDAGHAK